MPKEIECRFLVTERGPFFVNGAHHRPLEIEQGYFEARDALGNFRVRLYNAGKPSSAGELTVKIGRGREREESILPIPAEFSESILAVVPHVLRKSRFMEEGWDIDIFEESLSGIVLAEFETDDVRRLPGEIPSWLGRGIDVTEALTNLHLARLATLFGDSGADAFEFVMRRLRRRIVRIAVTGAPCSGKSTALRILREEMPQVKFLPELATLIMKEVGITPGPDRLTGRRFQQMIYRVAGVLEATSAEQAIEEGKIAIVCDRGKVDNAAYLEGGLEEFEELLLTTREVEYDQYDAVLCFERPSREVFEREKRSNPQRLESDYRTVRELAARTREAWSGHPNFIPIPNGRNWEEKVDAARQAIRSLIK